MKAKLLRISLLAITLFEGETLVRGQGTFQNLDFESSTVPDLPPGVFGSSVPIGNGLPGWTGYLGTNETGQVLHNNFFLGTASISILGPNWSFSSLLDGSYTALLQPGRGPEGVNVDVALSQSSMIPVTALSLQFKSDMFPHFFVITVADQALPTLLLSTGPNYTLYGADISNFAGLTREVRITAQYNNLDNGTAYLDSIVFSEQPIPEPGTLVLFALGALLLGWRFFWRSHTFLTLRAAPNMCFQETILPAIRAGETGRRGFDKRIDKVASHTDSRGLPRKNG